jgi:uncharacterized NAD(P)/FAD-binding protein YdhS
VKAAPHKFLAVVIAVALSAVFCHRAPSPDESIEPFSPELSAPAPDGVGLRSEAKRIIACEVASGQWSLVETAALFGALNRLSPMAPELSLQDNPPFSWVLSDPVHTEEERLCRQVVQWVDVLRRTESPEYVDAAVARLTAQFRQELQTRGAIRLPDPSSLESFENLLNRARASLSQSQRRAAVRSPAIGR